MNVQIPPIFFYVVGVILTLFGAARAYYLGWRIRQKNIDEGPLPRSRDQKRHLLWGVIYVLMGLFLVISTLRAQMLQRP